MPRLTDLQAILLTHAAQRTSGSLLPAPETVVANSSRVPAAIASLIKRGLAEERDTEDAPAEYRTEGEARIGAFVTAAGFAAIGVVEAGPSEDTVAARQPAAPPRVTKSAAVVQLLKRTDGATLPELVDATGWLPHTTRAALTMLRKKGHAIERSKRGEVTCYRIVSAA